jgi:hypothetical protein
VYFQLEHYDMSPLNEVTAQQFISYITMIDIDANGSLDVLGTSWDFFTDEMDPTYLWLNDGTGVFSISESPLISPNATRGGPNWPLPGDFNQDGLSDLYVPGMGNEGGEELPTWFMGTHHQLFLHQGTEGLLSVADSSAFDERRSVVHSAAIGDIDGDGDLDIYNGTLHFSQQQADENGFAIVLSHFFINDGEGNLSRDLSRIGPGLYTDLFNSAQSFLVDIDNDSDLDLLLTGDDPQELVAYPSVRVFLNDGSGFFQQAPAETVPAKVPSFFGCFGGAVEPSDINGDGWTDLLVNIGCPYEVTSNVQFLTNDGDGTFSDSSASLLLDEPWSPATDGGGADRFFIEDFNGDQWPDLLTKATDVPNRLLLNQGDGTMLEASEILDDMITDPQQIMNVADIDNDGDMDIIQVGHCSEALPFCPSMLVARNTTAYEPVSAPALPVQPVLTSPADGVEVEAVPNLGWNHVPGAQDYRVQVSQDEAFQVDSTHNLDFQRVTGNQLKISNLTSLVGFDGLQLFRRYYWRVAGLGHAGQGPWSQSRSFDIGDIQNVFANGFE